MQRPTRVPPQSLEAEQATLGAMLLERAAIEAAGERLKPEDFYRDAHKAIFAAACDLCARNEACDLTTLGEALEARGQLEQAGGRPYLVSLLNAVPTAAHVDFYAQIVRSKSLLRQVIHAGGEMAERAYGDVEDAEALLSEAEGLLSHIGRRKAERRVAWLAETAEESFRHYEVLLDAPSRTNGVPTGLTDLDRATSGWQAGDLHIIGGRPGMGKSALWLTCALSAVRAGFRVLAFSLEMTKQQFANRVFQQTAGIESWRLRTGKLDTEHWAALVRAVNDLRGGGQHQGDLGVCHERGITPRQALSIARRQQREAGLDLVIFDYLQRMGADGRWENETTRIASIADGVLGIADDLEIPVVAVSQLSREVERREDKRPNMADLRQSGRIEENAAFVGLLYRPGYYARQQGQTEPEEDPCELIIGKARHGGPPSVSLIFRPAQARFVDCTDGEGGDVE